jgi:hypothetical protein
METFLWWIGLYNVVGAPVLAAMHYERFADFMLRRGTEVVAEPYTHGRFGRMWLWWAASTNLFLGAVMMLATRWPPGAQREVSFGVIGVYAAMYLVVIFGARGPRYGRGVYTLYALWLAQIAWGVWAVWTTPVP